MTQIIADSKSKPLSMLRRVLVLNACTSFAAGLAAVVAPGAIADLLGLDGDRKLIVLAVGIGLVVFALDVAFTGLRASDDALPRNAGLISAADISWVIATVVVIATAEMSSTGQLIAVAMGLGVGGLAALQLGLR